MKDSNRAYQLITERVIEVIDDRQTGETILDEALKMIKSQEHDRLGINSWVDLMSGKPSKLDRLFFGFRRHVSPPILAIRHSFFPNSIPFSFVFDDSCIHHTASFHPVIRILSCHLPCPCDIDHILHVLLFWSPIY